MTKLFNNNNNNSNLYKLNKFIHNKSRDKIALIIFKISQ